MKSVPQRPHFVAWIGLVVLSLLVGLHLLSTYAGAQAQTTVTVSPAITHQTMGGWGADLSFTRNLNFASQDPLALQPAISLDRGGLVRVMNRLDHFYRAPKGFQRLEGLSLDGGPDFLSLATWIFDVYLNERLRGTSENAAWALTENAIKLTEEWRRKH